MLALAFLCSSIAMWWWWLGREGGGVSYVLLNQTKLFIITSVSEMYMLEVNYLSFPGFLSLPLVGATELKGSWFSFPVPSHTDTLLNLTIQIRSSWPNLHHHLGCTKQLVTFYTNRNISFYLPVPARLLRSQSPYIHLSLCSCLLVFLLPLDCDSLRARPVFVSPHHYDS